MESKEPYRATRLWNEVITAFQCGMPLKKHRRRIQTYNNCFTAAEAITWLHCYLLNNSNFGPNVTRQQAVNLLQKFLKCHVIESVVIRAKKKEFSDDSHLYRFSFISQISKPSTLCLLQSPSFGIRNHNNESLKKESFSKRTSPSLQKENLRECHFVERKLSPDEVKLMWQKVTLSRLETLLPEALICDILEEKIIDGHIIKHNATCLSKTGVVCLIDKTDDIPHWVISAMKCLANWPNASGSGSCLPNYPGFEKDVFKVVKDYFLNSQVPLLPPSLTPLLFKVFCHFSPDKCMNTYSLRNTPIASEISQTSKLSSAGVKTSTPVCNNEAVRRNSRDGSCLLEETSHGKLLLDDPEVMWDYPSVVFYETDFASSNPVTRIVSKQCTPRSKCSSYSNSIGSIDSVSTISICSISSNVLNKGMMMEKTPLKTWSSNLYLQDEIKESMSWQKNAVYIPQLKSTTSMTLTKGNRVSNHSNSASNSSCESNVYMCEINDFSTSNLNSTVIEVTERENDALYQSLQNLDLSSKAKYSQNSSSQPDRTPYRYLNQSFTKEYVYPEDLKSTFQLTLLFLLSTNRRQLHLLLRLLNKILKNDRFILNVKTSMRIYLLETFLPAIVQSDENPISLFHMTSFLLDNCEALFSTPKGLKEEVEDLSRSCYGRIKYTVDDTCFLTYCEMVSKQQYEQQKISLSVDALKSLLCSILQDQSISEKEKKRKIKQFKENHPDVYYLQFPEKQEYPLKPKRTFLNKLVNLRM